MLFSWGLVINVNHAEVHQEELPPYHPVDQRRCVWANPFTLPSTTVNGLYKGKRGWSKSVNNTEGIKFIY